MGCGLDVERTQDRGRLRGLRRPLAAKVRFRHPVNPFLWPGRGGVENAGVKDGAAHKITFNIPFEVSIGAVGTDDRPSSYNLANMVTQNHKLSFCRDWKLPG